jgi:hypothetical protein
MTPLDETTVKPKKRKTPPHAWKSGQSGNLKGRPRRGHPLEPWRIGREWKAFRQRMLELAASTATTDKEVIKAFRALVARTLPPEKPSKPRPILPWK